MSPEEIAEAFDYDVAAVKATLAQCCTDYRKSVTESDFSESDAAQATAALRELLCTTQDENLKFRVARYMRDDKKGRLDIVKQMGGLNVNIVQFNTDMKRAIEAVQRSKEPKVIAA